MAAGSATGASHMHETGTPGNLPAVNSDRKRWSMRAMRLLPLLAMASLLGCDGTGDFLRGRAPAAAYAAPLAADTTVVTTRRVWSSAGSNSDSIMSITSGAIMPNGAGMVSTDWLTGDPGVFDLTSKDFRRFRFNDVPWDTGFANVWVPSPDGSQIAVDWSNYVESLVELRIIDVATGTSRTVMTADTAIANAIMPVAWTPSGDGVFALLWPSHSVGGDVEVVLIPAAGGTPRPVHTIPSSARPYRMSLSSDGRWLLYSHRVLRDQQSRSDIYIIDVHSGGARPLVEHPATDQLVGWLPGTDVVLFSSDRSGATDLWSVRVINGRASAEPRLVRSGFFRSEAIGFGDGALFYSVQTGSNGLAVVNVDPQRGVPHGPASPTMTDLRSAFYRTLAWSPDGKTLAAPMRGLGSGTMTLYSMDTGETREFWLNEDVYPTAMAWAADGKALFLRAGAAGWNAAGPHHFLRLDLVTGAITRLFAAVEPEESGPHWRFLVTPDDRSIVLRQQRTLDDGRTEMTLVLRSLSDGSERELHRTSGYIPEFSLSADGTQLAFMQQVWERSDSLFVLRMDGSLPVRYVASWDYDTVSLLGWLPGGNALLGARLTGPYSGSRAEDGPREEILRIELDGSATVVGTSPFRPGRGARVQGYHRSRLVLSPAGNRLAHQHAVDVGQELWRMDGLHALFARDATGRR